MTGEEIAIVEPVTSERLPAEQVGEIWAGGPNVARAYWRNDAARAERLSTRVNYCSP